MFVPFVVPFVFVPLVTRCDGIAGGRQFCCARFAALAAAASAPTLAVSPCLHGCARHMGFEQNKQKNTALSRGVLAPVEGLEPPTLRLTAACSTD